MTLPADMELLSPLDLRRGDELTSLSDLKAGQARVVQSRVKLDLEGYTAWPLVPGPSAWFYLVHRPLPEAARVLDIVRRQHQEIIRLYRAQDGPGLESFLLRHMETEEATLYPLYARVVEERQIRELGYEHLGLRRGLPEWREMLTRTEVTKRERDGMDIKFFHLFEHHMEREEDSLLPVLELLCPREAAEAARAFTWGCSED